MRTRTRDEGAILVLTLILSVVLAVVVVAIASFVTVGLRASEATDHRNETNADGAAAVTWAMESFRDTSLDLSDCGNPAVDIIVPAEIRINGSAVTLKCETSIAGGTFPVVYLRARADNGSTVRIVEAVAQYSANEAVRALDWRVDNSDLIGP